MSHTDQSFDEELIDALNSLFWDTFNLADSGDYGAGSRNQAINEAKEAIKSLIESRIIQENEPEEPMTNYDNPLATLRIMRIEERNHLRESQRKVLNGEDS